MNAFTFRTVPEIINESGAAAKLGELLALRFAGRKAAVVTDLFLYQSGLLRPALQSLEAHGFAITIVTDVVADPPEHVVLSATERCRQADVDLVIGLGGGSSMDVAKLVAVLLGGGQALQQMYGVGNVTNPRLPLVQIPTTAGTGSEVTPISIVTTGETTKMGVVSPQLYADLAILDATLTLALPPKVTAATGIDAMVHAIEAYTSKLRKNPLADMLACEALRLLSANLLTVCRDGNNLAARQATLFGAMLAGQAFANAPVAAVHALAYPIGGIFHVPHGLSNSLVLPHVLRFNAPAAGDLYAELAEVVLPTVHGSSEAKTQAFIAYLQKLSVDTGIEQRLSQVGIQSSDLEQLAGDAMKQTRLLVNNPREVAYDDAFAIYQAAL